MIMMMMTTIRFRIIRQRPPPMWFSEYSMLFKFDRTWVIVFHSCLENAQTLSWLIGNALHNENEKSCLSWLKMRKKVEHLRSTAFHALLGPNKHPMFCRFFMFVCDNVPNGAKSRRFLRIATSWATHTIFAEEVRSSSLRTITVDGESGVTETRDSSPKLDLQEWFLHYSLWYRFWSHLSRFGNWWRCTSFENEL